MDQEKRLLIVQYDDMYMVDLSKISYFTADDHYTHAHYASGQDFLLPFGLQKIDALIHEKYTGEDNPFLRLGRKYIVNLERVFHISTAKQNLTLIDDAGQYTVLHIPKPVLRSLYELLTTNKPIQDTLETLPSTED